MKISRFTRRPWVVVTAVGIGISTLLGSGLFAAVVDAGTSQANGATSGDFNGVRNLQLALTAPNNTQCANVQWSDANVAAMTVGTADLDNGFLNLSTFQRICLRTRRAGTFAPSIFVSQLVDSETGCSSVGMPESSQDNDTCGTGAGELTKVLQLGGVTSEVTGTQSGCSVNWVPVAIRMLELESGGSPIRMCGIKDTDTVLSFIPNFKIDQHASSAALTAAQSDKVQFNYYVQLEQ